MKEKPRTFIVKRNLYLYFDEEGWSEDNPTVYGKDMGMTAKEVRDDLLYGTLYKGTKLTLVETDSGFMHKWRPYGLATKNGHIEVLLESERDINLDWFEEVS
jgi:hypothetical protein